MRVDRRKLRRAPLITMPNGDPAAGRAAWAKKRKRKAPAKATLERRAREARKKAAEKKSAAAAAAAAEEMDASGSAVGKGKGEASAASAASAASVEAEVEVKDWSQQKRARQSRTNGSAVWSTGVTARNARARSAERAAERAARRQRSGACCAVRRQRSGARSAPSADRGAEQRCLKGKWLLGITHTLIHSLQLIHLIWVQCRAHLILITYMYKEFT